MKQLLEKVIALVTKALQNRPDDNAAHTKLEKQVADLTAEKAELQTLTDPLNKLIDLATAATPGDGGGGGGTPTEGAVRISYKTVGKESQFLNFGNDGASEETAGRQSDIHQEGLNAALSEPLKGPAVPTNLSCSVNGVVTESKLTHLIQIAAYQSAVGGAVKAVADEQLAVLRALPEE